jgi:hypothetical protein
MRMGTILNLRPTFDDRHGISSNVYFHPDLILKISRDPLFGKLTNLPQVVAGNARHNETLGSVNHRAPRSHFRRYRRSTDDEHLASHIKDFQFFVEFCKSFEQVSPTEKRHYAYSNAPCVTNTPLRANDIGLCTKASA